MVRWTCVQPPDWPVLSSTGVHWSQQIVDSWDGGGRGELEFGAEEYWTEEERTFERLEERSKPGI